MFSASQWRGAALGAAVSMLAATSLSADSSPPARSSRAVHSAPSVVKAVTEPLSREDALPPLTATERKIDEALTKPTQMEFVETPLQDVVDFLKEYHGIEIQLDKKALDQANVATDAAVTLNLKGVRLVSALNLMLGKLDLAWTVRDDVLLITSQDNSEALAVTKLYAVGDLVVCRDAKGRPYDDYDTLTNLITSSVEPMTWDGVGGANSASGATFGNAKILVISAPYPVQRQVAELLRNIRTIARESPKSEPPRGGRS
jgi:hypothetical protein